MPTPYPNAYQIEEMFANRGFPDIFHTYLADNFDATVVGQDFHIGGHYNSLESFHNAIYGRVSAALKIETIRVEIVRVVGGGDSAWAAVESLCTATSKYGESDKKIPFLSVSRSRVLSVLFSSPLMIACATYLSARQTLSSGVCGLGSVQLAGEDCADEGVS